MHTKIKYGFLLLAGAVMATGCAPRVSIKQKQATTIEETEHYRSKYTGPKYRIGVVDFENKALYAQERLGSIASDILITELVKSDKFIVVERDKLAKLLEEQKLGLSGSIDPGTAAKAGRVLGLKAIVTGSVTQFGVKTEGTEYVVTQSKKQIAEATVDIRVVDVETGQVLLADSGKGVAQKTKRQVVGLGGRGGYDETLEGEALRAALVKFVDNIVSQVSRKPWSCKVAEVQNGQIYLDAGLASGLKAGLKLTAYRAGKEIISPTTGLVLGQTEEEIGQIKIARFFGEDGSIAELLKGESPARGDICRLKD